MTASEKFGLFLIIMGVYWSVSHEIYYSVEVLKKENIHGHTRKAFKRADPEFYLGWLAIIIGGIFFFAT